MYRFSHWLKEKIPFLWEIIERVNTFLFSVRYGKKLHLIGEVLSRYQVDYRIKEANLDDVGMIVAFFSSQPSDAYKYFTPHKFDSETISNLILNKSFLFFIVTKDEQMVGYFFLRCFFQGKCFRGKIVDYRWRNRGIAKLMGHVSMEVASALGLRIFGAISKDNVTSMASSAAVNEIKVIEELPNDYVYIEYLPKK